MMLMNSNDNNSFVVGVHHPLNFASSKQLLLEFLTNVILVHILTLCYSLHFLYELDVYVIFIPFILMDLYEFGLVLSRMYAIKNK
jgi:hypothetical protein